MINLQSLFSRISAKWAMAMLSLFCASALFVAAPQTAQAGQVEAGIGFGWMGDEDDDADDGNGPMFELQIGYRIYDWVGVYLDQDLGGIFWDRGRWEDDYSYFQGATILNARFFVPVSVIELQFKAGIGATYQAKHDDGEDWSEGQFAIRLGIGAFYDITTSFGIGATFEYTPAIGDDYVKHFVSLEAQARFKF